MLRPCGQALLEQRNAFEEFSASADSELKSKHPARVTAASLLLFARSNDKFSPKELCSAHHCGKELDVSLKGGASVEHWTDIESFTSIGTASAERLEVLVKRLRAAGAAGAIFSPTNKNTGVGDVFGLFKVNAQDNFVLLIAQCTDWFGEKFLVQFDQELSVADSWRKHRPQVYPQSEIQIQDDEHGKTIKVKVIHLLFSANDVPNLQATDYEGVVTFKSMRSWLPTAAYACEAITHLNAVFGFSGLEIPQEE